MLVCCLMLFVLFMLYARSTLVPPYCILSPANSAPLRPSHHNIAFFGCDVNLELHRSGLRRLLPRPLLPQPGPAADEARVRPERGAPSVEGDGRRVPRRGQRHAAPGAAQQHRGEPRGPPEEAARARLTSHGAAARVLCRRGGRATLFGLHEWPPLQHLRASCALLTHSHSHTAHAPSPRQVRTQSLSSTVWPAENRLPAACTRACRCPASRPDAIISHSHASPATSSTTGRCLCGAHPHTCHHMLGTHYKPSVHPLCLTAVPSEPQHTCKFRPTGEGRSPRHDTWRGDSPQRRARPCSSRHGTPTTSPSAFSTPSSAPPPRTLAAFRIASALYNAVIDFDVNRWWSEKTPLS